MLTRLKTLFATVEVRDAGPADDADLRLAAAALLVEAALGDGTFEGAEREVIGARLSDTFTLEADEARDLIAEAEAAVGDGHQLLPYTRVIKDRFDEKERIRLVEMLWEVVYADGQAHDYEANLLRRIAGLIYVADRDSGAARKRVLARRKKQSEAGGCSGDKRDQR